MESGHDERRSETRTRIAIKMDKYTYFISDLHLGANYIKSPIDHERHVVAWLDSIKDKAKSIYLMGDILDYWYEYRYVVPRGFTRFFGKIAELTDNGIEVFWFIGNHDIWIFDYLPKELGVTVIDGSLIKEIDGKRFYLAHGDGVGKRKKSFRFIRALFRNKFAQTLFSAIHPRWTVPFAHNWSSHSRKGHQSETDLIERGKASLESFSKKYNSKEHIDYFVYGHIHCVEDKEIAPGCKMIILGDWIKLFSYARFDGKDMEVSVFSK